MSTEAGSAAQGVDDREAKLYVDVNVANFGIKRIIVYEGDTVESLVADFVKKCPIDEFMIEKLKLLLQQQMDGVLERIDEDEEQKTDQSVLSDPEEGQGEGAVDLGGSAERQDNGTNQTNANGAFNSAQQMSAGLNEEHLAVTVDAKVEQQVLEGVQMQPFKEEGT